MSWQWSSPSGFEWIGFVLPPQLLGRVIASSLTLKEVAGKPWAQRRDRKLLLGLSAVGKGFQGGIWKFDEFFR